MPGHGVDGSQRMVVQPVGNRLPEVVEGVGGGDMLHAEAPNLFLREELEGHAARRHRKTQRTHVRRPPVHHQRPGSASGHAKVRPTSAHLLAPAPISALTVPLTTVLPDMIVMMMNE